jgi:hypothetical protein
MFFITFHEIRMLNQFKLINGIAKAMKKKVDNKVSVNKSRKVTSGIA